MCFSQSVRATISSAVVFVSCSRRAHLILSCLDLSYLILSHLVLSYRFLPYLFLSYLTLCPLVIFLATLKFALDVACFTLFSDRFALVVVCLPGGHGTSFHFASERGEEGGQLRVCWLWAGAVPVEHQVQQRHRLVRP